MKYKEVARRHAHAIQCSLNIDHSVELLVKEVAGKRYSAAILSTLVVMEQCQRMHEVCNMLRKGGEK